MNPGLTRMTHRLLLLAILSCPVLSPALESDSSQPIRIQADAAMVDKLEGTSFYRGNVVINQGTLKVAADEVEIHTLDSEVIQIIATAADEPGKLARYEQQINAEKDMVSAQARKITYLVQEERLHLSGTARLEQAGDEFTGDLLYYDLGRGIVNLNSDGGADRINMTITPKKSSN